MYKKDMTGRKQSSDDFFGLFVLFLSYVFFGLY